MQGDRLTRRSMLQGAGAILSANALRKRLDAAEPPSAVMTRLSGYMSEAREHALPDEVVEKTKHHILDTLAAMVSGSDLPPGRLAIQFARAHSGDKTAAVAGSHVTCGAIEAALVNGMLAHSDD